MRHNQVLIIHNPTRGVDVGGKAEIYQLSDQLADRNVAILLVSDELSELIGLSDTILVMRKGKVSRRVFRGRSSRRRKQLIRYML